MTQTGPQAHLQTHQDNEHLLPCVMSRGDWLKYLRIIYDEVANGEKNQHAMLSSGLQAAMDNGLAIDGLEDFRPVSKELIL